MGKTANEIYPRSLRQSFADHSQIVEAVSKGDSEAAGKAMRDHISIGGRVFADFVVEMARRSWRGVVV
jgi:DNA-binding FadR family transcriptional regulator